MIITDSSLRFWATLYWSTW